MADSDTSADCDLFKKHVESTLLIAEIHRCKICKFCTPLSNVMCGHLQASHARAVRGDISGHCDDALSTRKPNRSSFQKVLSEIQNIECVKLLTNEGMRLKVLSESKLDEIGRVGRLGADKTDLFKALEFLFAESENVDTKDKDDAVLATLGKDVNDQVNLTAQSVSTNIDDSVIKSAFNHASNRKNVKSKTRLLKTEMDANNSPDAVSGNLVPVKIEISRAYKADIETVNGSSGNRIVLDGNIGKVLKESAVSETPEQNLTASLDPSSAFTKDCQAPHAKRITCSDEAEIVKDGKDCRGSGSESQTEDLHVCLDTQNQVIRKADLIDDGDTAMTRDRSSTAKEQTSQEGEQSMAQVPIMTLEEASGKLYCSVDFQAIAQRASRSNPEATTITIVQHTGGNRPPTTIHFKKSNKSEAIIPTGESLGIESPFLRKEYAGSKIFACKECHSRYKTQKELERHTQKKHRKKKSYLCEVCGDALATRSGMKIHILRKHRAKAVLSCEICDYMTRSPARLRVHVKKHDKATSEFYCEPCKKSFVTESKLLQHRNSPMHKNAVDPIICEHCGYVTKKRDNFLVHLRKHTGEKPYRCNHCDYAAADGSTLKRHVMARHSSIRPFRCSQCQFSCVDKKGLTVHMRKHTGERPYTCDVCPYAAKRMGALTVHRRTHLREKSPPASDKEDLQIHGAAEVASYVDISDIPIAQVPFSAVNPGSTFAPQAGTRDAVGSGIISIATECQVIGSNHSPGVTVQVSKICTCESGSVACANDHQGDKRVGPSYPSHPSFLKGKSALIPCSFG